VEHDGIEPSTSAMPLRFRGGAAGRKTPRLRAPNARTSGSLPVVSSSSTVGVVGRSTPPGNGKSFSRALAESPSATSEAGGTLSRESRHRGVRDGFGRRSAETVKKVPLYATAVHTGMRMGELFGLRWTDVDFEMTRIHVRRSYRTTPKSGKGRTIPLSPHLAPVLRAWKAHCRSTAENLVFPSPVRDDRGKLTGEQRQELRRRVASGESRAELARLFGISWTAVNKIAASLPSNDSEPRLAMRSKDRDFGFHEALEGAGCHRVRFHDLRHTYASHFVMAGGNLLALQKLLGHADLKTTMKYAHLAPDYLAAEGALVSFAPRPSTSASIIALADRSTSAR
jgi:hypothetical protein